MGLGGPSPTTAIARLRGVKNLRTAQVAVAATPVQLSPVRTGRFELTLLNTDETVTCYYGNSSSVDSSTGFPLAPQASKTLYTQSEVWAVAASEVTVAVEEVYD